MPKGEIPVLNFNPEDAEAVERFLRCLDSKGVSDEAWLKELADADAETIRGVMLPFAKKGSSVEGIKNFAGGFLKFLQKSK